jgi:hypothetical protein
MAVAEPLGLYPLSSPDGQSIPYEVIRPIGLIRQDFNDVGSAAVTIPTAADILAFFANATCIVTFGATAVVPANGVHGLNSILIPANTYMNVDHNGAANFSVVGVSEAGTLFTVTVKKWQDTKKPIQFQRR